jgi:FHA domain
MDQELSPLGVPLAALIADARTLDADAFAAKHGKAFFMSVGGTGGNSKRPADTDVQAGSPKTADVSFRLYPILKRRAGTLAFISVGRLEGNDIALADAAVSKLHASIREKDGVFCIQDESSSHGTFVDNHPVPARDAGPAVKLTPRCSVRFASVNLVFLRASDVLDLARAMGGR